VRRGIDALSEELTLAPRNERACVPANLRFYAPVNGVFLADNIAD
jgi:hypothetical protein